MNLIPKLKLIPICLLLLLSVTGHAQRTHEGVVVEKKTGKAVPYASVRLLKENIAVSANEKGVFKLATKGDLITDTLIVTAVGYRSLKIPVMTIRSYLTCELEEDLQVLEEVIVSNQKRRTV